MQNLNFSKTLFEKNVALFLVNFFITKSLKNKSLEIYIEKNIEKDLIFDLVILENKNLVIFECKNTLSDSYLNDKQFKKYKSFFSSKVGIEILKDFFSFKNLEFDFFTKGVDEGFKSKFSPFLEFMGIYKLNVLNDTCRIIKISDKDLYADKYFLQTINISDIKIYIPFDWTKISKQIEINLENNKNEIKNLLVALQKFLIQNKWFNEKIPFDVFLEKYVFDEGGNRIYFGKTRNIDIVSIFYRIFRVVLNELEKFSKTRKGGIKFKKNEIIDKNKNLIPIIDDKKIRSWLKLISHFTIELEKRKEKPIELPLFD